MKPKLLSAKYPFVGGITKKLAGIKNEIISLFSNHKKTVVGGFWLVLATSLANLLNFGFNAYIGRAVSFEDIALVSFVAGLTSISRFSFSALSGSVNFKSSFLEGRYGSDESSIFWHYIKHRALQISLGLSIIWLALTPFLSQYFHTQSYWPIITFSLVWLTGFSAAVDRGFLSGKLLFGAIAAAVAIEPVVKFLSAIFFVQINRPELLYLSLPLSVLSVYLLNFFFTKRVAIGSVIAERKTEVLKFPLKYFTAQVVSGVSSMLFLTLDVVLAKHFLTPVDAGKYALVSLNGKMIFFSGGLASQFLVPLIGRNEGERKNSRSTFYYILAATTLLTFVGFFFFGLLSSVTSSILFGEKILSVQSLLLPYAFAMMCIAIARIFESYYLTKQLYLASFITFILAVLQIVLINIYHTTVYAIVVSVLVASVLYLLSMILLHLNSKKVWQIQKYLKELVEPGHPHDPKKLRVLILNWRDTKHKWAGGAEVYVQELAKKWIADGHHVTLFCGNDGKSKRNQTVNGVKVVRRGGTFSVYIWAFIYFVLFFRKNTDVIIDCENGIPFFTPLYAKKLTYLVIHHVHQEVFHNHLRFPFNQIACFLEGTVMPYLYRNNRIITVSESSKKEIIQLGFGKSENITVVHNGIENDSIKRLSKSRFPLMSYLGRLKSYKNIDIAIHAFAKVAANIPSFKFYIIGTGEDEKRLKKLVKKLHLYDSVLFLGRVSEKRKIELLSKSWFAVQPSMMEGWGITVIEANSCATPVIASRVNGLSDSIVDRRTGLLVQLKDIQKWSIAIESLVTDHKRRSEMSLEALEWSKNFSWRNSADRFMKIISQDLQKVAAKTVAQPLFRMGAQLR